MFTMNDVRIDPDGIFTVSEADDRFQNQREVYSLEEAQSQYEKKLLEKKEQDRKVNFEKLKQIVPHPAVTITLFPREIIFLQYNNKKNTKNFKEFPNYWYMQHGIQFQKVLEKFFKGGYLRFATEEEKLASLKKTELQELLAEHGLKKTGNKDALIRQILQNLPKEKYLPKIGFDVFLLTESGKEIIDKNDHLFFYDDIEIPIEMVDLARQMNPAFNKYQALRFSQGKRIRNLIRKQEYPSIGIALMSIAGTYLKEYEVKKAFSYVMLALYMDMFDDELKLLSCSESYKLLIQEIPEAYPGHFIIAPAKLVEFWSLKEKYDIAEDIVIEYVRQASDFLKMNVDPQKTRERIQELLSSRGEVILESDRPRWEP